MKTDYIEFLKSKMVIAPKSGIGIDKGEISDVLKPNGTEDKPCSKK